MRFRWKGNPYDPQYLRTRLEALVNDGYQIKAITPSYIAGKKSDVKETYTISFSNKTRFLFWGRRGFGYYCLHRQQDGVQTDNPCVSLSQITEKEFLKLVQKESNGAAAGVFAYFGLAVASAFEWLSCRGTADAWLLVWIAIKVVVFASASIMKGRILFLVDKMEALMQERMQTEVAAYNKTVHLEEPAPYGIDVGSPSRRTNSV